MPCSKPIEQWLDGYFFKLSFNDPFSGFPFILPTVICFRELINRIFLLYSKKVFIKN